MAENLVVPPFARMVLAMKAYAELPYFKAENRKSGNRKITNGKAWTEDDNEYLRIEAAKGRQYGEIAEDMGRTERAIKNQAYKLGVRSCSRKAGIRWTDAEDKELIRLWKEGVGDYGIAQRLGRSRSAVNNRGMWLDLKGRYGPRVRRRA